MFCHTAAFPLSFCIRQFLFLGDNFIYISALLWDFTHLQGSSSPEDFLPLKMGVTDCPETSGRNYHSTWCKIPN